VRGEKASQTRLMNLLSNDRTFARSIDIDEKFRNGVRHHSRFFHEELMSGAGYAVLLRTWEGRPPVRGHRGELGIGLATEQKGASGIFDHCEGRLPALQASKHAAMRSGSRRCRGIDQNLFGTRKSLCKHRQFFTMTALWESRIRPWKVYLSADKIPSRRTTFSSDF